MRSQWITFSGLACVINMAAQTAAISGTVSDLTGAAGSYSFPQLPTGEYELRAAKPGFQTAVHPSITLTAGANSMADFTLPVALDWSARFISSFADKVGTLFIGFILASLGVFSSKIVESIKFALNRADLRTKYY